MLPEASQARKAVWDAVNPHTGQRRINEAFPRELRESTRETDMAIRFKSGSLWQLVGSDNFNSLVGSPPIGVVFSEFALADPQRWGYLRPILAENGGWALFITTPRGRNHAATFYEAAHQDPTWFSEQLPATDTSGLHLGPARNRAPRAVAGIRARRWRGAVSAGVSGLFRRRRHGVVLRQPDGGGREGEADHEGAARCAVAGAYGVGSGDRRCDGDLVRAARGSGNPR